MQESEVNGQLLGVASIHHNPSEQLPTELGKVFVLFLWHESAIGSKKGVSSVQNMDKYTRHFIKNATKTGFLC